MTLPFVRFIFLVVRIFLKRSPLPIFGSLYVSLFALVLAIAAVYVLSKCFPIFVPAFICTGSVALSLLRSVSVAFGRANFLAICSSRLS